MRLFDDTRGSSGTEYILVALVVGALGLPALGTLGGAQRSAIGDDSGAPAGPLSAAAGTAPGAAPLPAPGGGVPLTTTAPVILAGPGALAGIGAGNTSGLAGAGAEPTAMSAILAGGPRTGGRPAFSAGPLGFTGGRSLARSVFDGATGPLRWGGSQLKTVLTNGMAVGLRMGLGAVRRFRGGGSCFNPLNTAGCLVDAVFGEDAPKLNADELPDPQSGDFRVLTLNTANGHTCKNTEDQNELDEDCAGDPDYYRTNENRSRLADVARDSQADVVALQEIDVGNDRSGNLDTGLRTAAQTHPALSIFLTGDPGTEYEVVAIGEDCSRLPCKKISPDGTVIYLTADGSYVSGSSICGLAGDNRCPRGSVDDPHFGSWDVADNEGYGDQVHIEGPKLSDDVCQAGPELLPEHRRYGTGTVIGPDQQVTDAYTVVLPNGKEDLAAPVGDRDALHDQNNARRLQYDGLKAREDAADAEAKAAAEANGETYNDVDPVDYEPRTALVTVVKSPDGTERVVINVHLARTGDAMQRAQLQAVAELVAAESAKGRDVVVTGDFNMQQDEIGEVFDNAGLQHASGSDIDQTWVLDGTGTVANADINTGGGSDHDLGATTTIR